MTYDQQFVALLAIRIRQDNIRSHLSGASPIMLQHMTKELEDLEGAYAAIDAIELEQLGGGD